MNTITERPGLRITEHEGGGLFLLAARDAPPVDPNGVFTDAGLEYFWFGPRHRLVRGERETMARHPAMATVIDVSAAYRTFSLRGSNVPAFLARGSAVDFAGGACAPRACCLTNFGRIRVFIHREARELFEILVERSLAVHFIEEAEVILDMIAPRHERW
ncbi:MAG: hypothetical protein HYY36_03270 [Gammaproteobacteria bacterium]|nr:hypothetical protein [Gammaproteobacteria bacterium]